MKRKRVNILNIGIAISSISIVIVLTSFNIYENYSVYKLSKTELSTWLCDVRAIDISFPDKRTDKILNYDLRIDTITKLFDGKQCWSQPRIGVIPKDSSSEHPRIIINLDRNNLYLKHPDMFSGVYTMRSDDYGNKWHGPVLQPFLRPRLLDSNGNITEQIVDPDEMQWTQIGTPAEFNPKWHRKSQKLLAIGMTPIYANSTISLKGGRRSPVYSVYDQKQNLFFWNVDQFIRLPDLEKFFYVRASANQWVELDDGRILLPFSYREKGSKSGGVAVMLCEFDGEKLTYIRHGNEMTVPYGRGFLEPQLTKYKENFYLTIRNDVCGFVTKSKDGLNYEEARPWTCDVNSKWPADHPVLQTYGAQQHWVTHSNGLYLVYARRDVSNDHVYRHRSPLFMAMVDEKNLRIIQATEQKIIPERGARMANFDVINIDENETWVVTAEWMQPPGCEEYGSNGSVFISRIRWSQKNINY